MEKVNIFSKIRAIMRVIGSIIKCVGEEIYSSMMGIYNIQDNGEMMNLMDGEPLTPNIQTGRNMKDVTMKDTRI